MIVVGLIFIVFFLKALLVKKLTNELKHTFGNYYTIKYNSIETSIGWNGLSIVIDQPTFTSDTSDHESNLKFPALFFHSQKLVIGNLSIRKLLFTNDLQFGEITLKKPRLKFIVFSNDSTVRAEKPTMKNRKKNIDDNLIIQKIKIENGSLVSCHYNEKADTTFLGFNINASLENLNIDIAKIKTLAYALKNENNFCFSVGKAYYKPFQSNYLFAMDTLVLNDKTKVISAKNLAETTLKSKLALSRLSRYSKIIPETKIASFKLEGYDLKKLFLNNTIRVKTIFLNEIDLEMFKNKQQQLNTSDEKPLFQNMLTSFPFLLIIDSVYITNSAMSFELIDHKTKTPVAFYLNHINAVLTKINTLQKSIDTMMLTSTGRFMNAANFKIKAIFPDLYNDANYYSGYVGPMSFNKFNLILSSYSGIKIVEGKIKSIVFSGWCNKFENYGSLVFKYNDLEIEVDKTNRQGKRKKAKLISMFGNMVLHNNNPRDKKNPAASVSYYFRRQKYQNHVVLWVGGLLEGVKNTLVNKNTVDRGKKYLKKRNN